jgi:glycosyltransferase involved in cell wall biosynthesis
LTASLCVVLPVRNAQANLADFAAGLLEVLPELSVCFELLVIDNGSQDATLDVAQELELSYPQVRILRHGSPLDLAGIVRTTLAHTRCEQILLCDEGCLLELRDLHKLWRSRNNYDAVLAWPAGAGAVDEEACSQRVRAWRLRLARPSIPLAKESLPGYQLLHRRVLETIRWASCDRYELLAELSRHGLRWQVVEVRRARPQAAAIAAVERPGQSMRVDRQSAALSGPATARTTRSVDAIKEFALGE